MLAGPIRSRKARGSLAAAVVAALFASSCGGSIGYALRPENIKNCRGQSIRLAIANFEDGRPKEERDQDARIRLVGEDEAKGYTDYSSDATPAKVADQMARHLAFAGCFSQIDRVDLPSDEDIEYLKRDIRKLSSNYDAVMIGKLTHLWGFQGTTTDGDRRVVKAQAQLTDLKIIRTRDLRMIWAGSADAHVDELESNRPGNQYRIAGETLRDAVNKIVVELNRQRLSAR